MLALGCLLEALHCQIGCESRNAFKFLYKCVNLRVGRRALMAAFTHCFAGLCAEGCKSMIKGDLLLEGAAIERRALKQGLHSDQANALRHLASEPGVSMNTHVNAHTRTHMRTHMRTRMHAPMQPPTHTHTHVHKPPSKHMIDIARSNVHMSNNCSMP